MRSSSEIAVDKHARELEDRARRRVEQFAKVLDTENIEINYTRVEDPSKVSVRAFRANAHNQLEAELAAAERRRVAAGLPDPLSEEGLRAAEAELEKSDLFD